MVRVYELVRLVASHPITVLISGETGVGKEVIAAAIHAASARKRGPLVRVNCASLPESLLESALFGHERGAFTGAERKKVGYFEAAHGGTLFLDEIGEMTPALQAKLLRVLEHRTIIRVGGVDEIEIDVRVVCATHRDLQEEVKQNTFRSDLYFRVTGFTILVPPLRQRIAEIEPLARIFLQQSAATLQRLAPSIAPEALDALKRYDWPGNVRELRNAIERAMVLHTGGVIHLEDLPVLREVQDDGGVPPAAAAGGAGGHLAGVVERLQGNLPQHLLAAPHAEEKTAVDEAHPAPVDHHPVLLPGGEVHGQRHGDHDGRRDGPLPDAREGLQPRRDGHARQHQQNDQQREAEAPPALHKLLARAHRAPSIAGVGGR